MEHEVSIKDVVEKIVKNLQREECMTCECFQGFLSQLEMDAEDSGNGDIECIRKYKMSGSSVHGCLGCVPCVPGDAFTGYLRAKSNPS